MKTNKGLDALLNRNTNKMSVNEYGLDTHYVGKNLNIFCRDINSYSPEQMHRALICLANTLPVKTDKETPQTICANLLKTGRVVILDTETTGLGDADEVVEVGVLDQFAQPLIDTLIKPNGLIPLEATEIHKITTARANKDGMGWQVCQDLLAELEGFTVVMYNGVFDLKMIKQTDEIHATPARIDLEPQTVDLMELANRHFIDSAQWHPERSQFKRLSLKACCELAGIEYPDDAHQALTDCRLTLALMQFIANDTGR